MDTSFLQFMTSPMYGYFEMAASASIQTEASAEAGKIDA
jgi:hypothetical protein